MKHVFISLELPWVTRNSQTTAVLLAMFGGTPALVNFAEMLLRPYRAPEFSHSQDPKMG